MGFYVTKLGDAQIVLEAPASGAFAKGASDVEADPRTAMANIIRNIRQVGSALGSELVPIVRNLGMAMDVSFAVRADSYGVVMVSQNTSEGQFLVTVKMIPGGPPGGGPPRPPGPPPGPGGPQPGVPLGPPPGTPR
jgi:hypothetical protein